MLQAIGRETGRPGPVGDRGERASATAAAATAVPRVKGVAFRSVLSALEQLRGRAAVDLAITRMPDELSQALRYGTVLPTGWYPTAWYRAMWAGVRAATGEGLDLARHIGREAIRSDMTGLYRLVFKMFSPETVLSQSRRMFNNYYSHGSLEVIDSRSGYGKAIWRGCEGFDRMMWVEILGSSEELLELAGAKFVRVQLLRGGQDGDDFADAEARWAP
jgi:hypothetical protein